VSDQLEACVEVLKAGRLAVIPTDTVYGVAAAPGTVPGVEALFEAKGRPHDKAIPVLAASAEDLAGVAEFDELATSIATRFWPGPLTLVLNRAAEFDHDLGGTGDKTVAVRVPRFPLTLELLALSGPLAVTSANRSGQSAALTAASARAQLGPKVDVYLDGGELKGKPSTIISLVGRPRLLRTGALDPELVLGTV
jgi:L-threonylcarbamoyladenylate synthase